jgi:acetyl-CoA C-acetyltransferase
MNAAPRNVHVMAARRTAVAPRNGAFGKIEVSDLAAPVIDALLQDSGIAAGRIDHVLMGNALYGGGNPARVAALAAGLDPSIPANTLDSQCCAGLDAIIFGASLVASGQADVVIAGGVESYSRSPLRARRPREPGEAPAPYLRPPFTPWPDADPDMIEAAASLAVQLKLSRRAQEEFAVESHNKAMATMEQNAGERVEIAGLSRDAFSRHLSEAACRRLPLVAGSEDAGLTPATVAVEADAAAAVLLASDEALAGSGSKYRPVRIVRGRAGGGDPLRPGLVPIAVAQALLRETGTASDELCAVEVMEAFAVQAMAFIDVLQLSPAIVNRGGGALSRGHPIGASGAILAVRLFHELQPSSEGARGLAAIAAAGGLGSALLLQV